MARYGRVGAIQIGDYRVVSVNYIGPILFGLFFLSMSGEVRAKTGDFIGSMMNWIEVTRPLSYMILCGFAACALLAFLLVARWPQREEAINPLVQYRRDHPEMDE